MWFHPNLLWFRVICLARSVASITPHRFLCCVTMLITSIILLSMVSNNNQVVSIFRTVCKVLEKRTCQRCPLLSIQHCNGPHHRGAQNIMCFFLFLRQPYYVDTWSSCFSLLSAGITGVGHHAQLLHAWMKEGARVAYACKGDRQALWWNRQPGWPGQMGFFNQKSW